MFRKVVVPVDGSMFSERALPYAATIVRASGGELDLVLVHVREAPASADLRLLPELDDWEIDHRQREAEYLERLVLRVQEEHELAPRRTLLDGEIVPSLERHVKESGTDLVVLTSHGRAGLERAWLGSVSDAVLRKLEIPVMLIRPSDTEPLARSREPEFRHILIALDGSPRAERAIAPALALARNGARVTLLRVIAPDSGASSPYLPHAVVFTREQLEKRRTEALRYVDETTCAVRRGGAVEVAGSVVIDYHPAHAILDYAAQHGIDLLALGSHGRNPVARLLLGSVSDKVVRAAATPVLLC